jgi:hypothetical protein
MKPSELQEQITQLQITYQRTVIEEERAELETALVSSALKLDQLEENTTSRRVDEVADFLSQNQRESAPRAAIEHSLEYLMNARSASTVQQRGTAVTIAAFSFADTLDRSDGGTKHVDSLNRQIERESLRNK